MSDTTAYDLARAVLRAFFDGATFRRVPARCIRATQEVLVRIETQGRIEGVDALSARTNEDGTKGK